MGINYSSEPSLELLCVTVMPFRLASEAAAKPVDAGLRSVAVHPEVDQLIVGHLVMHRRS